MSSWSQRLITALVACILGLLIAGCGRVQSVPVACVQTADIPPDPASVKPRLTGNAAVDVIVLADAVLAWKQVAIERGALLAGCAA